MTICPNCQSSEIEYDSAQGNSVCIRCGAVLEENAVVAELTFNELANGASVLEGHFIAADRGKAALPTIFGRRVGDVGRATGTANGGAGTGTAMTAGGGVESREMTLANGRRRLQALAGAVGLTGEHYVDAAHRWYALALQHQFTRGRRGPNVIAACLYIVCRQERTPHMLLDFADVLSASVYSLGGTFLRLVRLLNLEIPIVDPSFYVARFAARLEFGERSAQVANTALRLVARMKRDWIQTGRRPAGVCAAGLIIAARMHGFRRTEAQVVRVVRICEATLRKRLEEFGRTASSQLTPQEFEGIWLEQEADPPSFNHTRSKPAEPDTIHILLPSDLASSNHPRITYHHPHDSPPPEELPPTPQSLPWLTDKETLSDVEVDEEIESIMLNEEEITVKTRLWTELNQDYLDREAEKDRLRQVAEAQLTKPADIQTTAITKEGYEAEVILEDPLGNHAHQALMASSKKVANKKRTRSSKNNNTISKNKGIPVAATPAEAAKQVLQNKRFSKKINYEALEELFTATAASVSAATAAAAAAAGR